MIFGRGATCDVGWTGTALGTGPALAQPTTASESSAATILRRMGRPLHRGLTPSISHPGLASPASSAGFLCGVRVGDREDSGAACPEQRSAAGTALAASALPSGVGELEAVAQARLRADFDAPLAQSRPHPAHIDPQPMAVVAALLGPGVGQRGRGAAQQLSQDGVLGCRQSKVGWQGARPMAAIVHAGGVSPVAPNSVRAHAPPPHDVITAAV